MTDGFSLESSKYLTRYMFYTRILCKDDDGTIVEDEKSRYPCASFRSRMLSGDCFFISTCQGPHKCLEEGDKVNIFNTAHESFAVKVVFCNDESDFVLFESPEKLSEHGPHVGQPFEGQNFVMLVGFINVDMNNTFINLLFLLISYLYNSFYMHVEKIMETGGSSRIGES